MQRGGFKKRLECSPFAKTHFETWFSILWLILARYELVHYSVFTMYILYIGICRERERERESVCICVRTELGNKKSASKCCRGFQSLGSLMILQPSLEVCKCFSIAGGFGDWGMATGGQRVV